MERSVTPEERTAMVKAMAQEFGRVHAVDVQEGDVFLLSMNRRMDEHERTLLYASWKAAWSDFPKAPKLFILEDGATMQVVRGANLMEKEQ